MTTKTDALDHLVKVAVDYGVSKVEYDSNDQITIVYNELGEGTGLSSIIEDYMSEHYPDFSLNIKMIPSDKQLLINIL